MKNISYDLIEKFRETGNGEEAENTILRRESDPAYLYALSPNRENLLEWYPFKKEMSVLMLGAGYGAACGMLSERVGRLDVRDLHAENLEVLRFRYPQRMRENGGNISLIKNITASSLYDAVVIPELSCELLCEFLPAGYLAQRAETEKEEERDGIASEQTEAQRALQNLPAFLSEAASCLREGGALLLAAENAGALRYLAGDVPPEDRVAATREYLRHTIEKLPFSASGWYYPLPDLRLTKDIFSDAYLPSEGNFRSISDAYEKPRYLTCDEEAVYGRLCAEHAFPEFAPAYFLVLSGYRKPETGGTRFAGEAQEAEGAATALRASEDGMSLQKQAEEAQEEKRMSRKTPAGGAVLPLPKQIYIRYNRTRLPQYQTRTEILEENGVRTVRKTALSKAANDHILSLEWKYKLLEKDADSALLVQTPRFSKENGVYSASFAFLDGAPLSKLLAEEIEDGRPPVAKIKAALELVLGVGVHPCHNMDCLFENVMKCGDRFYYLDYEWVFEDTLDRGYLRYRMLRYWYEAYRESLSACPDLPAFLQLFGIGKEDLPDYERMEASFQKFVHGEGQESFIANYRQGVKTVSELHETEERLAEFTEWNLRLQDEVEEHKETIAKDVEVMRLTQTHVLNIESANRIHERDIAALQAELAYLRRHESLPSRAKRAVQRKLEESFPEGSRKRKLLDYGFGTFRHPFSSMKLYLTEEGRNRILGDFKIGGEYGEGGRLTLPDCLHYEDLFAAEGTAASEGKIRPRVSIVLPVYNQVAYTYACVRSILAHTDFSETPYEVILADDVSQDATAEIGRFIRGMVISRNTENQGFLKNCNQAAKKALGEYIFFLNNDTKVKDGWLSSLVRLMDADESIGMAGSKLIYPDGRLQEAGGIIWSDASGWNYGRLDDPEKPEYNYVKDVDYISGAAIMIRKSLWEEIGGFDERFAPAYCEDSDLAFEVRKHGKRVVYQPQSVVVHFEGISNGTDVNGTGLKKYQLVNQKTFREKWKTELQRQSKNDGNPNPFTARDRSQKKPCILVVDHYVPTWDKDAGSRTTYQYIRMFLKKGYNVKFLGDNFLHEEPYSSELQQLGVEILYGESMQQGIWNWIRSNQAFIDIAYLNRPHIAVKYIDYLRDHTDIKCIYYGHDLHFMRLMREYELCGDIRVKREADYWKSIEFGVMSKCDVSYYPSELEAEAIRALNPAINVHALTAYVWEKFLPQSALFSGAADYEKREGLLFVGGFAHPPNEDGILWFAKEIFPKIRAKLPNLRLYVAGSKATEAVQALGARPEESGIEVLGFVSDAQLSELYRKTRLTVVPLRYGAGVKGKVVEALYHGSVIVTTSVGAEGIPEAGKVLTIANESDADLHEHAEETAERFAESVLRLYGDPALCAKISADTQRYIRSFYSMDAAWRIIAADFRVTKKRSGETGQ